MMNEREELKAEIKAVVKRLQPHEVEALAVHLEQAGFRKTVELGEVDIWAMFDPDRAYDKTSDGKWEDVIKIDDARRLAAPKERWVAVSREEVMVAVSGHLGFTGVYNRVWEGSFNVDLLVDRIMKLLPPPPTTPAQTAKEGI